MKEIQILNDFKLSRNPLSVNVNEINDKHQTQVTEVKRKKGFEIAHTEQTLLTFHEKYFHKERYPQP